MSQETQAESLAQAQTRAIYDPVEQENIDELHKLLSYLPGRIFMLNTMFDHMAALLALVDFETTDNKASYTRSTEEAMAEYQERFKGFTVNDFEALPKQLRSALRSALMQRGIYMGKHNANHAEALANLISLRNPPIWNAAKLEASQAPAQQHWAIFNPQTPMHTVAPTGQAPMQSTTPWAPPPSNLQYVSPTPQPRQALLPAFNQPSSIPNVSPPTQQSKPTPRPPNQPPLPAHFPSPPPHAPNPSPPPQGQQGYNPGYNPGYGTGQAQPPPPIAGNASGPPGPPPGGPYMTSAVPPNVGPSGGNQPTRGYGFSS
ncbi:hypothetical protein F4813DRAFT_393986 [Daldinia decipiens]|uniref:uncharacterized protein n=1 Tax=Daldinia decipiens TaxID=326647 RepID=UPI0020C25E97|nr:uncharacterized protein F4813DRAFT_393986 [Daldinia decipiens]KAI1653195.1 hypothetical protein F4813DRAFT_393986 [Daldinia decipiens]